MVDLATILASHQVKKSTKGEALPDLAKFAEIPDIFFDNILIEFHLGRIDILVLIYIYRSVWCRPNLYREYGIGPILSHEEVAKKLKIKVEELQHTLMNLETLMLIETVRLGQYFIRKYFTEEYDNHYGQHYDQF